MPKKVMRICAICKKDFDVKEIGRMKILRREVKGEKCVWLCKDCATKVKIS
ncbi:MAG: hypothetical protein QXO70_03100 [Candidatus Pacearchaeota archaeon]